MAQIFKPNVLLSKLTFSNSKDLYTETKKCIIKNKKIPEALKNLALSLLEHAQSGAPYPPKSVWAFAKKLKQDKANGLTVNAMTNDFGEILGPIMLCKSEKYKPKTGKKWLVYPEEGNAASYDYQINGIMYSAKKGSGATNTVGLDQLTKSKQFDDLPNSLEKSLCEHVKDTSALYMPIEAIMFLISKGIKLPTIDEKVFRTGYEKGLSTNSVVSKEWIEILKHNNVTSKYFKGNAYNPIPVVVCKIQSSKKGICTLTEGPLEKSTKYQYAEKISSKHDLVGLYIRPLGSTSEGALIKGYSKDKKTCTLSNDLLLKAGVRVEIYVKDKNAMTAKLIAGVCAEEMATISKIDNGLDFTPLMSTFAPIIVKLSLSESGASIKLGGGGKKLIRNKNYPTNPRGIVRGKLGIQP